MTTLAQSRWFWFVFAILTFAVYFSGLGVALVGPDEPRYAQIAREMFDRGDWVTPTLGGFSWFEKPALLYWLQIGSYSIFGVNEFAARLPSAIFGILTIGSLWLIARSVRQSGFPAIVVAVTASTLGLIVFSHGASFDIMVTFPMTAAMVSFFIYDRAKTRPSGNLIERGRPKWHIPPLAAFYFFVGVAVLAKGLIGIVLPYGIVAVYFLMSRRWPNRQLVISLFWGTLVAVVVASTWYLPMYLTHGYAFLDEFFVQHHFQRYTSNKYLHPQPFHFFFWVLPLMTIPWLPFFAAAIIRGLLDLFSRKHAEPESRRSTNEDAEHPESDGPQFPNSLSALLTFSAAWIMVPLIFFSFSGSKLPGYILPSVPPAVLIACVLIADLIARSYIWRYVTQVTALSMLLAVHITISFALPSYADEDSVRSLIEFANLRGFATQKVVAYQFVAHNAEFYAAGRLLRDSDGKQFFVQDNYSFGHVFSQTGGEPFLLLVRANRLEEVENLPDLHTETLAFNGKLFLVSVFPAY